jgi:PAS domain S-box-containing protein
MVSTRGLKYIFVFAFGIAVVFPLLAAYVIFPSFHHLVVSNTEDEAVRIARYLASFVVSENHELKEPGEIRESVESIRDEFVLERVKVFSASGEIIYSTDPNDIGQLNTKDYFREVVARGSTYTNVVKKDTRSLEDRIVTSDVVETYVPIMVDGTFVGAFEIYYDITRKNEMLNNLVLRSSLILLLLMLVSLVVLSVFTAKAIRLDVHEEAEDVSSRLRSPFSSLVLIASSIFIAESIVMLFLSVLPPMTGFSEALLDSALLVMLVSPVLYFFLLRPLILHINERRRAERELRDYQDHLEQVVEERTADLKEANVELEREIAEHRRTEEALRESEKKYRDLVNNPLVGVFQSNLKGDLLFVNEALARMNEFDTPAEMMTEGVLARYKHPERRGVLIDQLKRDGKVDNFEIDVLTKSGKGINILVNAVLEGEIISGMVLDISERKKLEEQLRHAQKMEALGTLTGGVAHEFNNIMTAILGYGEFLREEIERDSSLRNHVDMIISSAERAARLTHGLLVYSRKQITHMEPVNIRDVMETTETLLPKLVGENVALTIEARNGDLAVVADKVQIEQVLLNLAMNAADAMPGGGRITMRAHAVKYAEEVIENHARIPPGEYVRVDVSDTGTGIGQDIRDKIFEPFFTTKEVGKGTGLGLSMVYGIVKRHGGYITVDSEPGRGATFKVFLLSSGSAQPAEHVTEEEDVEKGTETVLIAEDDDTIRELMRVTLERAGYTVIEAVDGEDAVQKFIGNRDRVRLLLFDVVMPGKNGREAYEEIRSVSPGVKVLFISGYVSDDIRSKGMLGEEHALIHKPVAPRELLRKIREALSAL